MQTVKPIGITLIAVLAITVMQAPAGADGSDPFRGPWRKTAARVTEAETPVPVAESADRVPRTVGIKGIRFFQNVISPIDGDRCPMIPSCSSFGIHAIKKHGLLLGIVMTTARLTHEQGEMAIAPRIRTHDGFRFYDPVENNDFWFIKTDKKQQTNIPGVYAAGDICGPPRQMAKAVGEGCVAGIEAATYAKKQGPVP